MTNNGFGGVTIVGGIHVSNFAVLAAVGLLAVGAAFGVNFIAKKGWGKNHESYAARAYQADSDPHNVARRILQTITAHAENRQEVLENTDWVAAKINENMPTINSLVQQRRNGEITRQQFREKIRQLIIQIMGDLEMGLRPRTRNIGAGLLQYNRRF